MRRRNMYYLTGLPGWMRFGYSPGWVGQSPTGMGPGASYMMTGQWPTPQAQAYWDAMQAGQAPFPAYGMGMPGMGMPGMGVPPGAGIPREQELAMLKDQADWLKAQMDQITARMQELEKEKEE